MSALSTPRISRRTRAKLRAMQHLEDRAMLDIGVAFDSGTNTLIFTDTQSGGVGADTSIEIEQIGSIVRVSETSGLVFVIDASAAGLVVLDPVDGAYVDIDFLVVASGVENVRFDLGAGVDLVSVTGLGGVTMPGLEVHLGGNVGDQLSFVVDLTLTDEDLHVTGGDVLITDFLTIETSTGWIELASVDLEVVAGTGFLVSAGDVRLGNVSGAGGLFVSADLNFAAGDINLGEDLTATISLAGGVHTMTLGAVTADSITLSGDGGDDSITISGLVQSLTGQVSITGFDAVNLEADVNSAAALELTNNSDVFLDTNVDLTAVDAINLGTSNLHLGATGLNILTAGGQINFQDATITGAADLTITSNANVLNLGEINTTGDITLQATASGILTLFDDVTTIGELVLSNITTVRLAEGVSIDVGGDLDLQTGVTGIELLGDAGTNRIEASGDVWLADVFESGLGVDVFAAVAGANLRLDAVTLATGQLNLRSDSQNAVDGHIDVFGAVVAGSLHARGGTGNFDDRLVFWSTVDVDGDIDIADFIDVHLRGNVDAAGSINFGNVRHVPVHAGVNLTAGGDITLSASALLSVAGTGTTTVTAGGDVSLGRIGSFVGGSTANLTILADGNVDVAGTVDLGGALSIFADVDDNADATVHLRGAVVAESLFVRGGTGSADDQLFIFSTVNVSGNVDLGDFIAVHIRGNVDAGGDITMTEVRHVPLFANVNLTADGDITLPASALLSVAGTGTTTVTAGGNVSLGRIGSFVGGSTAGLTILADGDVVVAGDVNLGGALTIFADVDNSAWVTVDLRGAIVAESLYVRGGTGSADDDLFIQSTVNVSGDVDLGDFIAVHIRGNVDAGGDITLTEVRHVPLFANVNLTAGGDITLPASALLSVAGTGTSTVTAGGDVSLGHIGSFVGGSTAGLTINSDGHVTTGSVTLGGALNVSFDVDGDQVGDLTVVGNVNAASVTISGSGESAGIVNLQGAVATTGSVLIDNVLAVHLHGNVDAGGDVIVTNTRHVALLGNVNIDADGDIAISGVSQISFVGVAGTNNSITADGTLSLAYLVDSGVQATSPSSVTLGGTSVALQGSDLQGSLHVNADLDGQSQPQITSTIPLQAEGGVFFNGQLQVQVANVNIVGDATVRLSGNRFQVLDGAAIVFDANSAVITDLNLTASGDVALDYSGGFFWLPGGIDVDAGVGGDYTVTVIGTTGADFAVVNNTTIVANHTEVRGANLTDVDLQLSSGSNQVYLNSNLYNVSVSVAGNQNTLDMTFMPEAINLNFNLNTAQSIGGGSTLTLDGQYQTVVGSTLNDVIIGGNYRQVIYGNAGDNQIVAGTAGSILIGGSGNDTLIGGSASDLLIGGSGTNNLQGNAGSDILIGGSVSLSQEQLLQVLSDFETAADIDAAIAAISATLNAGVITDHGAANQLHGGADADLFFQGANDILVDFTAADRVIAV